ncbi:putative 40S ribosomal protein S21 [Trypanosoma vivax]|nr:putative 40S ribosomal protein S21 [Trypanosoma vivax]
MATIGTLNEEGTNVDLYIPRKCHATNTLITSFDHSAVQIPIANVDARGVIDGTTTTLCIAGYLRAQAESDHAINHLAISKGIIRIKTGKKVRAKTRDVKAVAGARGAARGVAGRKGGRQTTGQKGVPQRGGKPGKSEEHSRKRQGQQPQPQQQQQQQRGAKSDNRAPQPRNKQGRSERR